MLSIVQVKSKSNITFRSIYNVLISAFSKAIRCTKMKMRERVLGTGLCSNSRVKNPALLDCPVFALSHSKDGKAIVAILGLSESFGGDHFHN